MLHILRGRPFAHFIRSSHHEQIASLFTLSSLFFLACARNDGLSLLCSAAYSPRAASGPAGIGDSHPLLSMLIDVCLCRHQWRSLEPESPIPIARSHTIVICKGNHKNVNCTGTSSLKRVKGAIHMHYRGPTEQRFYVREPHQRGSMGPPYRKVRSYPLIKEGLLSH